MSPVAVLRVALWVSVALNLFGGALFLTPATGHPSPLLPLDPTPYYAAQLALVILVFAFAYGWLATQRVVDRPLLATGALGKMGFFTVSLAFGLAGDLTMAEVAQATPDLVLGGVFAWYLLATR